MAWTGLALTVAGRSILNQAQMSKRLKFKSIVVGDGQEPANFSTLKELVHQLYELTDLKIDVVENKCILTADFPKVDYDYYFREIGVMVTTEDGEKLYAYDNCGDDAQYIVNSTGVEATKKRIRLSLTISDVENITVEEPDILYVAYDDYEKAIEEIRNTANTDKEELKKDIAETERKASEYTDEKYQQTTEETDEKIKALHIENKVDKVAGKGLSTNDYTTKEKSKLSGIAAGAEVNVQADWTVTDKNSDAYIKNKPTSLPASDVSAWAKQPTKPTYSKSEVGLGNVNNTSDISKPVSTAQQAAIDAAYQQATAYADRIVNALVNGAPSTLDTLGEIAEAMKDNEDVVQALEQAIGTKASEADFEGHTGNNTIHITKTERANWNDANSKKHTHDNKSVLDAITSAIVSKWNNAVTHISDAIKHITAAERTKWNNGSANYGACSTAAATAAKTVACTGFELATGAEITVKFTVTNTAANPTLNVNNTGAKAIYYRGSAIVAGYLTANRTYTFRYNGTQWDLVGDLDTNNKYSNMTGATASAAGKAGLVPAPAAGAQAKYLRGDGTFESVDDHKATFNSGDAISPTGWTDIAAVTSSEAHSSLWRKFSLAVKNLRYLWKLIGNTQLSVGDGTVTGAINALNTDISKFLNPIRIVSKTYIITPTQNNSVVDLSYDLSDLLLDGYQFSSLVVGSVAYCGSYLYQQATITNISSYKGTAKISFLNTTSVAIKISAMTFRAEAYNL